MRSSPPNPISEHDVPTTVSASRPGGESSLGCTIAVVAGPDTGLRVPIDGASGPRALIGKSPVCHVRLTDPQVSRRHAAIDLDHRGVRLVDLGSTNGTEVGGLHVFDVILATGATFRLGDTTLRVESLTPATAPSSDADRFGKTIGSSAAMRRLYPSFAKLAGTNVPVLIEGETGTGKEVLAESLHDASARRDGPFVIFDCTTVVPNLVEAALFGHERGAFTGAVSSQPGVFEEANGGTLFLDEIGDLDLALQAKLLRAIERGEVRRVGGSGFIKTDVRLLSATRRDLDREIAAGRFRDDLFFRLAVTRIELPPLRRREGDIARLAIAFSRALGGDPSSLTGDFLRKLEDYEWPGNIRQLRNVIAQHVALGEASLPVDKGRSHLEDEGQAGDRIAAIVASDLPFFAARDAVLNAFERDFVARVLAQHGGHVGRAAEASGMGRRYFQRIRNRARDGSSEE